MLHHDWVPFFFPGQASLEELAKHDTDAVQGKQWNWPQDHYDGPSAVDYSRATLFVDLKLAQSNEG